MAKNKYAAPKPTKAPVAHYRQGDLLIVRVDTLPEGAVPAGTDVLLEGETTGHAHRVRAAEVYTVAAQAKAVLYVVATTAARVVHEEHHTIDLPPGLYRVQRQQEYVAPDVAQYVVD